MKLRELREKRAEIVKDMRALVETAGDDMSDDDQAKFDGMKSELETLEKRIDRQELIDAADRRVQGESITGSGDDRLDRELRSFSLLRAIGIHVPGVAETIDCGREREMSAELARRSGRKPEGVLVPMEVFQRPIEHRVLTTANPAARSRLQSSGDRSSRGAVHRHPAGTPRHRAARRAGADRAPGRCGRSRSARAARRPNGSRRMARSRRAIPSSGRLSMVAEACRVASLS